jgi:hypothetical protein
MSSTQIWLCFLSVFLLSCSRTIPLGVLPQHREVGNWLTCLWELSFYEPLAHPFSGISKDSRYSWAFVVITAASEVELEAILCQELGIRGCLVFLTSVSWCCWYYYYINSKLLPGELSTALQREHALLWKRVVGAWWYYLVVMNLPLWQIISPFCS